MNSGRAGFAAGLAGEHARRLHGDRRGFTLVEVLVTLLLLGIVLPTIMRGVALASTVASDAHRRTEAAGLAQAKLAEIVADDLWESGNLSGDFSPDFPQYRWQASVQAWAGDQKTATAMLAIVSTSRPT